MNCSMLGQWFAYIFGGWYCQASLWILTEITFCFVFFGVVGFILTCVTSNTLFFAFCIITVRNCVLWHEHCQNGHRWHPEACYFVSLPENEEVMDIQKKTFWVESKHKLAASLEQLAVLSLPVCVSGGRVPLSVHPPLALDPRFPAHLHEAMYTSSVSHFISDLCNGKGCQVNSSAPHCLLSPRPGHSGAWHSSLQDLARQGFSGSPRGGGGRNGRGCPEPAG